MGAATKLPFTRMTHQRNTFYCRVAWAAMCRSPASHAAQVLARENQACSALCPGAGARLLLQIDAYRLTHHPGMRVLTPPMLRGWAGADPARPGLFPRKLARGVERSRPRVDFMASGNASAPMSLIPGQYVADLV